MENLPPTSSYPQTSFATPEPTQVQPEKSSKLLIIFLSLFVLLLVGGIIFVFKQPKVVQAPVDSDAVLEALPNPTTGEISNPGVDTRDWATFSNPETGFSLKYPKSVALNAETKSAQGLVLTVTAEKFSEIPADLPLTLGKQDAVAEKDLLAKGKILNIAKIGALNGQITQNLSQFEVCSTMFVRQLRFYPGETRVTVALTAPKSMIMAAMPEFFQVDQANCGSELVWNRTKIDGFMSTLADGQGKGMAQDWYNTFDQIVASVQLDKSVSENISKSLVYQNNQYNFELTYELPYKVSDTKAELAAYPNGVALIHQNGQAYNIVVEVWDDSAGYKTKYVDRMTDLRVLRTQGKFISLFNNTKTAENRKIIDSAKLINNQL